MKASNINVKLYLEGVPVPFTSISINEQVGAAPTALITIPAVPELAKLHPKTIAHVFYKMKFPWEEEEGSKYYIIFEGELNGYSFDARNNGNNVSLTFVGLTGNWKRTYKTIIDFSLDTFQTGKFLLITDNPNKKLTISSNQVPERVKESDITDKKQSNLLIGTIPGTTITARLEQSINKFINSGSKTPVKDTMKSLLNDLADSNPYYARTQEIYKILDRIEVLENSQMKNNVKGAALSEMFRKTISQLPSVADGSQILKHFLDRLEYFYIEPSAPTLGKDGSPKSIIFSPETMSMLPLRCNTFFPSEVGQATFNHNFDMEPTRYVVSTPPLSVQNSTLGVAYSLQPKFIVPRTEVEYITKGDRKNLPAMGFTYEEYLRGPNPGMGAYTEAELGYVSFTRELTGDTEKTNTETEQSIQRKLRSSGYGFYIRSVAQFKYLKSKFQNRQYSFMVPYNPVRLVGLPGLVINEKLPSVIGKIYSISTTLTAEGQGTSSISMQYPRTIIDYDFPNPGNPKDPWNSGHFDMFTDEWPQTPFWIDPNTYGPDNVGDALKPIVYPDFEDSVVTTFHKSTNPPAKLGDESMDTINVVAKSINELKKKTAIYKDKYVFIDKETKRKLVSEEDFWKFYLNGNNLDHEKDTNYDSIDNMEYFASTRVFKFNPKKPFLKERRDRVLKVKEVLK
jgi:hypothetical protein